MKIIAMLGDVFTSLFRAPVTRRYPAQRSPIPPRLRGMLRWHPEKCTGCQLCTRDCPSDAIQLFTLDKKAKRFVMRYDVDRCLFCGQCVVNCRFGCLEMTEGAWELAALGRDGFTVYFGEEADVETVLAEHAADHVDEPAPS
jgi:formate hydrogenlyase subunit 6/NADH:ubiquinone oxidoreductase subunit I